MQHLYATANLNLFDDDYLSTTNFSTHQDRIEYLVQHWNQTVNKDSWIVITGNISSTGFGPEISKVLCRLNGKKYLLYSIKDSLFTEQEWKDYGIDMCFNCPVSCDTKDGKRVVLTTECLHNKRTDEVQLLGTNTKYYGTELYKDANPDVDLFCQGTTQYLQKMREDRVLNIDINRWDYSPLLCQNLYPIYKQMEDYGA